MITRTTIASFYHGRARVSNNGENRERQFSGDGTPRAAFPTNGENAGVVDLS
ncbi:MAG: hypothetical protein FWG36_09160 [Oscillospiraceae bacterium]|nr:hypothetical protein [Oscillospiraceae bacterium]